MGNKNSNVNIQTKVKYGGFSKDEIENYRLFFNKNLVDSSGHMSKKKLMKYLMLETTQDADKIFGFFDFDETSIVDSYKFVCGMSLLRQASLAEKSHIFFNIFNSDHSALLDQQEINNFLKSIHVLLREQSVIPSHIEIIIDPFQKYDYNQDGFMNLKEFEDFFLQDNYILEFLKIIGVITVEDLKNTQDISKDDNILLRDEQSWHEYVQNQEQYERIHELDKTNENDLQSIQPWRRFLDKQTPECFDLKSLKNQIPNAQLQLEFIYGISHIGQRNHVKYISSSDIVYPVGSVIVVYHAEDQNQRFYYGHQDKVYCIDTHDMKVISGDIGQKPIINIWDALKLETLVTLSGLLDQGISKVCFSQDGAFVAGVSLGDNKIAVYDVTKCIEQDEKVGFVASSGQNEKKIMDIGFDQTGKSLVSACEDEIVVFAINEKLNLIQSHIQKHKVENQTILSLAILNEVLVCGTSEGQLLIYSQRPDLQQLTYKYEDDASDLRAHDGPITSVIAQKEGLVYSSGHDGMVNLWKFGSYFKLMKNLSFNVADESVQPLSSKIIAINELNQNQYLILTDSSDLIEMKKRVPRVVMRGHTKINLTAITPQSNLIPESQHQFFYTAGIDGSINQYRVEEKQVLVQQKLEGYSFTCCHASKDYLVCAGYNTQKQGIVCFFKLPDVMIQNQMILTLDYPVSCIKFSPKEDKVLIAVQQPISSVFIYDFPSLSIKNKLQGLTSTIQNIDFSKDQSMVRVVTVEQEIAHFDSSNGKPIQDVFSDVKNETWSTWTTPCGWGVSGIWPESSDGSDIYSLDRSQDEKYVISGDKFGKIKLFNYPAVENNMSHVTYSGHEGPVSGIKFMKDYVFTLGSKDLGVFQWKLIKDDEIYDEFEKDNIQEQDELKSDEKQEEKLIYQSQIMSQLHDQNQVGEDLSLLLQESQLPGDERLSFNPFMQVNNMCPDYLQPPFNHFNKKPSSKLNLTYVNGFRCYDGARHTAKFLKDLKVMFLSAGLAVNQDPEQNTQQHFTHHTDDVISMTVHPNKQIVATSQRQAKLFQRDGRKRVPILVWDIQDQSVYGERKKNKNIIECGEFHQREVSLLAFSDSGKWLASIGGDDDHTLGIWDWKKGRLIANCKVDKSKVTGLYWKDDNQIATCGPRHLKLHQLHGTKIKSKKASNMQKPFVPQTQVISFQHLWVSANTQGKLLTFTKDFSYMGKQHGAHDKAVSILQNQNPYFLSGGQDGRIIQWQLVGGDIQQQTILLDINAYAEFSPSIVTIDTMQQQYLVGTKGGELFHIKNPRENLYEKINQGHSSGEVWGLAVHPSQQQCITCGGDKIIRKWNMNTDRNPYTMQVASRPFQNEIYALDYSPNGKVIVAIDSFAQAFLIDGETLKEMDQYKTPFKGKAGKNPWCEVVKFSPDGAYVVFGVHGGEPNLQVLEISNKKLENKGLIRAALSSAVVSIDWSQDSQSFIINTQDYFVRAYTIREMKQDPKLNSYSNVEQSTYTNKISYMTQGLFVSADYTDINSISVSKSRKLVAIADDFGQVGLSYWPCINVKQKRQFYYGHSSHVTRVQFTNDDQNLVSIGGYDKSVMFWRVNQNDEELQPDFDEGEIKQKKRNQRQDSNNLFEQEQIHEGDEFMAVKPWLGAIKEPSNYKPQRQPLKAPSVQLDLNYAYGYRAKDCRNNLRYVPQNTPQSQNNLLAYHTAALGVIMDHQTNKQEFFNKHSDDIISFDLHPDKKIIATGQLGPKPSIYLWDVETKQLLSTLSNKMTKGINFITFSPSGKYLACSCIDVNHELFVWDLEQKMVVQKQRGGQCLVLGLKFNQSEDQIMVVGVKTQAIWNWKEKNQLKNMPDSRDKVIYCVGWTQNKWVMSIGHGNLQVYGSLSSAKDLKISNKIMDSIFCDEQMIVLGDREGQIHMLDAQTLEKIQTVNLEKMLKGSINIEIRAIDILKDKMIIGTYGSEIWELNMVGKDLIQPKKVMSCHYTPNQKWTNEVWGQSWIQETQLFITVSDDATMRIWNADEKKQLSMYVFWQGESNVNIKDMDDKYKARTVNVCKDDDNICFILVGFYDGSCGAYSLNLNNLQIDQLKKWKPHKDWISTIKFSPNKQTFALGSHDNTISIYKINRQKNKLSFNRMFKLKKHSSYITQLDFSIDSQFLHSTCGAYELLFWNLVKGQQITRGATQLRDEDWDTWTTTLGWPVQGIWPKESKGTDINTVERSSLKHPEGYQILAKGDDHGKINLMKYPTTQKGSKTVEGKGHSSHVTMVRWSDDDKWLLSTGGEDQTLLQWQVKRI